jgi:hypothetical protein
VIGLQTALPRRLVAAALLLALAGCTTFGTVPTKEFITAKRPQQVWVYKADSSVVLVRGPHFLPGGDTLVGLVEGSYQEMPLSDIQQVKATRSAPMRTTALVVGGVGVVVGTVLVIKKSNQSGDATCAATTAGCDVSNIYP